MIDPKQYRKEIMVLLELLASKEKQLEYQKNVPYVNVRDELVCMWFDDLYHPEDAYFQGCFRLTELTALKHFDTRYRALKKCLPDKDDVSTWHTSPVWQEIMKAAGQARQSIMNEPDGVGQL